MSGRPLSAWLADQAGSVPKPGLETLIWISLEPRDRSWLHQRIALRFKHMLKRGLLDEVSALMAQENMHASLPSMRAVGYRQCLQWLLGQADQGSSLEEQGIAATGDNLPSANSPGCAPCHNARSLPAMIRAS